MKVLVAAPLTVEWLAVRSARTAVVHTGMGPRRSRRSARKLGDAAVLVAGVGGGLAPSVNVGDLVVASEVRSADGTAVPCPTATRLVTELERLGLSVHYGPVFSTPRLVGGPDRAELAGTGALAVDMESAWLGPSGGRPFAVVRSISDTAAQPLLHPRALHNGWTALRSLRRAVPAVDAWADAVLENHADVPEVT
jgi:4-hydroxy-3-methylbut-2-enyl diphosphate reductase